VNRHARRVPERIQDVLEAIGDIAADTQGMTESEFLADGKTQRAVIESLIVMGEAANRIMRHESTDGFGGTDRSPQGAGQTVQPGA
jgi:uncharacterized protein with HEPN domain